MSPKNQQMQNGWSFNSIIKALQALGCWSIGAVPSIMSWELTHRHHSLLVTSSHSFSALSRWFPDLVPSLHAWAGPAANLRRIGLVSKKLQHRVALGWRQCCLVSLWILWFSEHSAHDLPSAYQTPPKCANLFDSENRQCLATLSPKKLPILVGPAAVKLHFSTWSKIKGPK